MRSSYFTIAAIETFVRSFYFTTAESSKSVTAMLLGQEVVGGEGAGKKQKVQTNR